MAATEWARIELRGVTKVYGTERRGTHGTAALKDVSFAVASEEVACLVGPSGCGKTTVLNLVAGFDQPTSGQVLMDGRPVSGIGKERVVVFQTPALFSWLNVLDNVTFGPRLQGLPRSAYMERAVQILESVGLRGFGGHYPYQLSGGMRQRVQIARALLVQPEVLLLDEPFGALDAQTRLVMQAMLLDVQRRYGCTILFITHDVEEALLVADRVYIMSPRPGTIRERVEVPWGRPRSVSLVGEPEFARLRAHVLSLLRLGENGDGSFA